MFVNSCWPDDDMPNPHLAASYEAVKPEGLRVEKQNPQENLNKVDKTYQNHNKIHDFHPTSTFKFSSTNILILN